MVRADEPPAFQLGRPAAPARPRTRMHAAAGGVLVDHQRVVAVLVNAALDPQPVDAFAIEASGPHLPEQTIHHGDSSSVHRAFAGIWILPRLPKLIGNATSKSRRRHDRCSRTRSRFPCSLLVDRSTHRWARCCKRQSSPGTSEYRRNRHRGKGVGRSNKRESRKAAGRGRMDHRCEGCSSGTPVAVHCRNRTPCRSTFRRQDVESSIAFGRSHSCNGWRRGRPGDSSNYTPGPRCMRRPGRAYTCLGGPQQLDRRIHRSSSRPCPSRAGLRRVRSTRIHRPC